MPSKSQLIGAGIVAGAAVFIGYCVYYDRKRRSHPDYKRKIRERRAAERMKKSKQTENTTSSAELPSFSNANEAQAFFLQEVQLGEELLSEGDMENAVDHLYNAVRMCGAPGQLVEILRQTLPPTAYALLTQRLEASSSASANMAQQAGAGQFMLNANQHLVEEELE